jgi:AGZA family xanthine/uracil permease-like MFS transporter
LNGATQSKLDRYFSLSERGTSPGREALAGTTTFLTMAYIVLVNPAILGQAGLPVAAVAAATCFAAAFASILMGMYANVPLALAPGMGLNAYFAFTVVGQMGVPWPVALGCVFISGVAFLLLTLTGLRQMIVRAIPMHLFAAVAGGIGLFIGFIGLKNAGIIVANPATFVSLGDLHAPGAVLALFGLLVMGTLSIWNVRGAILIGIVLTTLLAAVFGQIEFKPEPYSLATITGTVFKLDLPGVFKLSGGLLEILFVFLFVDLFDNIGTLVAVTKRAGLMDEAGNIEGLNKILVTDAAATMVGSLAGTSTVTSYVESAAGVQAGGRTGLTAVVVAGLFLAALFFAPIAGVVPAYATAPALLFVACLMLRDLVDVDWSDTTESVPAAITALVIPFTYSIAHGIAFGFITYAGLKLLTGQARQVKPVVWVIAVVFLIKYSYVSG